MLKLKTLTIRNFLSIGNSTQTLKFNEEDLVLVLGENLDQGGNDNRNGCGKSSILNAISYALYGQALVGIKLGNLINLTNEKQMYVTLEFTKDNNKYRIERGRKPNIFKFIVNDKEQENESTDEAQGENRQTQKELENVLGFSHEMFKQIVGLNTTTTPFLSMRVHEQRAMIEELLGISKLSEKSEKLKEYLKQTKEEIREEEILIKATQEANKRIEQNIAHLKERSDKWEYEHKEALVDTQLAIDALTSLDIENEIRMHGIKNKRSDLLTKKKAYLKEISHLQIGLNKTIKDLESATNDLDIALGATCPACQQELVHTHVQDELVNNLKSRVEEKAASKVDLESQIATLQEKLDGLDISDEVCDTFYPTIEDAYNHKNSLNILKSNLDLEQNKVNTYTDQIEQLVTTALQPVTYDTINELTTLKEHQEFLVKLLTNKDSFVRKKIIDQNINYLNSRLTHYLEKIGLPHVVKFMNDLSVSISEHGRELDFDNLSRGEKTRLMLSLSWSFRDVYESMNGRINLLFVDEYLDLGMDSSGVDSALSILKKMSRESNRSIYLVSHREELVGRVDNILKVVKENGFTTLENNN